jgi:hypothetical protein
MKKERDFNKFFIIWVKTKLGKYQDFFGITRLYNTVVEGFCWWELSSGNLYTFIRPNQEQLEKMQLQGVSISQIR